MTLLEPKIEKSPTCCKFENFDPDPQLDIKFWNAFQNSFYNPLKKMMKKVTLLEPKIEKSPTCCKFENFDPSPQLDIKF